MYKINIIHTRKITLLLVGVFQVSSQVTVER